jgi:hypothetical protein
MGIGYILLIGFLGYATLKFYETQKQIEKDLSNRGTLQPGVSYYCNLAVSQRPQQVLAAQVWNGDQSVELGYAPAFGPVENMPNPGNELYY